MLSTMIIRSNAAFLNPALFKSPSCVSCFRRSASSKAPTPNLRYPTMDNLKEDLYRKWCESLSVEDRQQLMVALQSEIEYREKAPMAVISRKELFQVGTFHALPYVGFGFLDNFVMIVTGDYIEMYFAVYGMSTMAAAGIGNAISDACGIGSAYYVEALTKRMGFTEPILTPLQTNARSTTWAINSGRAIGVVIGCILGMVPLLWRKKKEVKKCEDCESSKEEDTEKPKEESKPQVSVL